MKNIEEKMKLIEGELGKALLVYHRTDETLDKEEDILWWNVETWTDILKDYKTCEGKPFVSGVEYIATKIDYCHDMHRTEDWVIWDDIEMDYMKIGGQKSIDYYKTRQAYLN